MSKHSIDALCTSNSSSEKVRDPNKPWNVKLIEALLAIPNVFLTGTYAWGIQTDKSDMDIVIGSDFYDSIELQNLLVKHHTYTDSMATTGSIHLMEDDIGMATYTGINLIVVDTEDYLRWHAATRMMLALVQGNSTYKAILTRNKGIRHGVFQMLRATLKIIDGVA